MITLVTTTRYNEHNKNNSKIHPLYLINQFMTRHFICIENESSLTEFCGVLKIKHCQLTLVGVLFVIKRYKLIMCQRINVHFDIYKESMFRFSLIILQ